VHVICLPQKPLQAVLIYANNIGHNRYIPRVKVTPHVEYDLSIRVRGDELGREAVSRGVSHGYRVAKQGVEVGRRDGLRRVAEVLAPS